MTWILKLVAYVVVIGLGFGTAYSTLWPRAEDSPPLRGQAGRASDPGGRVWELERRVARVRRTLRWCFVWGVGALVLLALAGTVPALGWLYIVAQRIALVVAGVYLVLSVWMGWLLGQLKVLDQDNPTLPHWARRRR